DDPLKIDMLVVIGLDAEEAPAPLVMRGHRDFGKECIDGILVDTKILKDVVCPLLHDILGTGTRSHARNFGSDALSHDRLAEGPFCNRPRMDLDYFVAGRVTYRRLALDHELAAHEDLRAIGVLMTIKQFPCHRAAEILYLVDLAIDRL